MRFDGKTNRRRVMSLKLDEISAVDRPAHPAAVAAILKRAEPIVEDFDELDYWLNKADFSAQQRRDLADSGAAMADGSFPIRNRQDLMNAIHAWGRANPDRRKAVAGHIRSRAKALGLSDLLPQEGPLAGLLSKGQETASSPNPNMDEKQLLAKANEQLALMQKQTERLTKQAELNDAQRAIFAKLDPSGQDQFLALSPEQRQAEVAKVASADPVVYTSPNGETFRKSDDPRLVRMAKDRDDDRKARIEAEGVAKAERLSKQAKDLLPNLPGDELTKVALLEAVDGIPLEKRTKVLELLKAGNTAMSGAFETRGASGEDEQTGGIEAEIEKLALEVRKADPKLSLEQAYTKAVMTPVGKKLYAQLLAERS